MYSEINKQIITHGKTNSVWGTVSGPEAKDTEDLGTLDTEDKPN